MHRQALEVLPALLAALGVDTAQRPVWLFGHSDGGSIALLHGALRPTHTAGLVVLAPHMASGTHDTRQAMADLVLANLLAGLAGEPLPARAV